MAPVNLPNTFDLTCFMSKTQLLAKCVRAFIIKMSFGFRAQPPLKYYLAYCNLVRSLVTLKSQKLVPNRYKFFFNLHYGATLDSCWLSLRTKIIINVSFRVLLDVLKEFGIKNFAKCTELLGFNRPPREGRIFPCSWQVRDRQKNLKNFFLLFYLQFL